MHLVKPNFPLKYGYWLKLRYKQANEAGAARHAESWNSERKRIIFGVYKQVNNKQKAQL